MTKRILAAGGSAQCPRPRGRAAQPHTSESGQVTLKESVVPLGLALANKRPAIDEKRKLQIEGSQGARKGARKGLGAREVARKLGKELAKRRRNEGPTGGIASGLDILSGLRSRRTHSGKLTSSFRSWSSTLSEYQMESDYRGCSRTNAWDFYPPPAQSPCRFRVWQ